MITVTEKTQHHITIPHSEKQTLTWLELDARAFDHNVQQYKEMVHPALLAVVVKSNAYGHGMLQIAQLAQNNAHVDYLCTVSLSEAVALREQGITKPLLVLSILDDTLENACLYAIDVVIFSWQQALALQECARTHDKKVKVHIKIDTGLTRLGIPKAHAVTFIQNVRQLSHVKVEGIFTHFAESEKADQTFTHLQIERFNEVQEALKKEGIHIPLQHTSCSAAITASLHSHFTMARAGIGIYGLWPSAENKEMTEQNFSAFSLKPVLTWKTTILHVQEIHAGTSIGYDRTFFAHKTTRIATLPIGYWDGYDRELSNKGIVFIKDKPARIVGRIAMNLMMVDISEIDASVGDEVMPLGARQGITADELALACNTINYEFVTRINPLLPRIIREN